MRNIPEHSQAKTIWYCAQYWPSYDLVELAILDEGIGIRKSLLSNFAYGELVSDDYEALKLSLSPGISRTFAPGSENLSDDEWKNSGFGLYMVSRLCDKLSGSFIISSGNSAIKISDDKKFTQYDTSFKGTAIQIRIRPSRINKYEEIAKNILREGELIAHESLNSFNSASRSSKNIFGD